MKVEVSPAFCLKRYPGWFAAACGLSFGLLMGLSGVCAGDSDFEMQVYDQPYSKSLIREDKTRLTVQVDPNNRRVEEVLYSPNQTVLWRLIRELDAAYQPIRGTKFDAFDQIVSRHKYFWLRGRLEEEEIYSARNVLLARMRYYYDAKGRPEKIEHYNASDVLISVTRSSGPGVEPIRRETKAGAQSSRKSR
jgi:hypothetical protein